MTVKLIRKSFTVWVCEFRSCDKGKKGQYICIAPYCRQPTSKALRYGNALSRNITFLPTNPRVYPRTEWTIPAFAFPAEAGTHLGYRPRKDGRLSWVNSRPRTAMQCLSRAANRSKHHASLGKYVYAACPELLPGVVEAFWVSSQTR